DPLDGRHEGLERREERAVRLGKVAERQPERLEGAEERSLGRRRLAARDPDGDRLRLVLDRVDRPRELADRIAQARHDAIANASVMTRENVHGQTAEENLERACEPRRRPGLEPTVQLAAGARRVEVLPLL